MAFLNAERVVGVMARVSRDQPMPRKPFKQFADRNRGGLMDIGPRAIPLRPEHFAAVGKCLAAWQEAEMALALGQMIGANNTAAMAVFQTLRRSSMQRDAMLEAAKVSLSETDNELIIAILNVHQSIEKERNALTHGHLGVYSKLEDGIVWLSSTDYIAFKAELILIGDRSYDEAKRNKVNLALRYYTKADLERVLNDIDDLGWIWSDAIRYLQEKAPETRNARYRQLCGRPRVARELEKLREKKAVQVQAPETEDGQDGS
jgi:hypothetical protein